MTLAQKTSWGLMNDWLGLIVQITAWGLSTPSSFMLIYRKFFVHPAITASISENKNEWMLHWNLEKNLVTIVCGHQAIIIFFRHTSCIFFGSLSGFTLLHGGHSSSSSWLWRLALIPLLFIVHSLNLITLVVPYLNLSSQLDWELREVRDNPV